MSTTTSTILVAEEHHGTRAFLASNLAPDGYSVLLAPDRAKAVALLSTSHPDLLLVDINGESTSRWSTRSAAARVSPAGSTRTSR